MSPGPSASEWCKQLHHKAAIGTQGVLGVVSSRGLTFNATWAHKRSTWQRQKLWQMVVVRRMCVCVYVGLCCTMLDHAATCCTVLPYDLPTLPSASILTANGECGHVTYRLHRERDSHASAWIGVRCTLHKTPQVSSGVRLKASHSTITSVGDCEHVASRTFHIRCRRELRGPCRPRTRRADGPAR